MENTILYTCNEEIGLQAVHTLRVPITHPSIRVILWQQRVFVKDFGTGKYLEESVYIAPLVKQDQERVDDVGASC